MYIYTYTYIHIYTPTYIYIYMYENILNFKLFETNPPNRF